MTELKDRNSKLIKNSVYYIILGFLPLGVNFFLAPIYTYYLTPSEYGILSLAVLFQSFLINFVSLSLDSAFARFYFDYDKKLKLINALISTVILAIIGFSIIVGIILLFFGDYLFSQFFNNEKFTFSTYGYLVFFYTISIAISNVFLSYYRNKEDVKNYGIVSLSYFFFSISGILIGLVYYEAGALGSIAGRMLGGVLVVVILLLSFFYREKIIFKKRYFWLMLNFSLPIFPYLLLLTAYNNLDRFMIEQYLNLSALGIYTFGFLLASSTSVFIYSLFNALSPRIYKLLAENELKHGMEINRINIIFQLLILIVVTVGLAFVTPVIHLFISDQYFEVNDYISLLFLSYIIHGYYMIYTIPLFFYKHTNILPYISLIAFVVGVVSNIILIPSFGIKGVCFALLFTKVSQLGGALFFVYRYNYNEKRYLNMNKNHILSISIFLIFFLIYFINEENQILFNYQLHLIPLFIFFILGWYLFNKEMKLLYPYILKETKKIGIIRYWVN